MASLTSNHDDPRELQSDARPAAREFSRDVRRRAARQRELGAHHGEETAQLRLAAADERDAMAQVRDLAALARDQAAAARDLAMEQREQDFRAGAVTDAEISMRLAEYRALAAKDRQRGAQDREEASRERLRALVDREALVRDVATTETDPLTGARTRSAGLADLDHELERCRRTDSRLIVAYVRLIAPKARAAAAGDALLAPVVALIRAYLRPYDLIVRLAGDEFLCAMSSMTLPDARERFGAIVGASHDCEIRTGFVEFAPDETAAELVARADSQLPDMQEREPQSSA